ncbi:Ribosomal protein L28/L24 [Gracilaria domingensis]|nr:Ribosomal protein L28/L24 [Gracilaria domingensis]
MPRFNRAYKGLYGNRMIQFGNKVSFAENKSRRTWKPNVQKTTMFSDTLQRKLTFRVTTYAMRCIRKAGGIDEYLIKTKDDEIKYDKAIAIKQEIIAARKARFGVVNPPKEQKRSEHVRSRYRTRQRTHDEKDNHHESNHHGSGMPLRPTSAAMFRSTGLKELLS